MGDREVDQRLVERVRRGDKKAFELLVAKYQRKLNRLLSRFIRDPIMWGTWYVTLLRKLKKSSRSRADIGRRQLPQIRHDPNS